MFQLLLKLKYSNFEFESSIFERFKTLSTLRLEISDKLSDILNPWHKKLSLIGVFLISRCVSEFSQCLLQLLLVALSLLFMQNELAAELCCCLATLQ